MTCGPATTNGQILLFKWTMAVTADFQPGGKVQEARSPQGGLNARQG